MSNDHDGSSRRTLREILRFFGWRYPPSTFLNVYGAKFPKFAVRNSPEEHWVMEQFDLEDLMLRNWIPLRQNEDLEHSTSLGNIKEQSIVHYRLDVLAAGQQAIVTFHFSTPPGYHNKVQIFLGEELNAEFETTPEPVYTWRDYNRSVMVRGDGITNFDLYLRPTRAGGLLVEHFLFFKDQVDVELVEH